MTAPYYSDETVTLHHDHALDALQGMPSESVSCVVTSPPYFGLRDYGVEGSAWPEVTFCQIPGAEATTVPAMTCPLGQEPDLLAFVAHLSAIFREAYRVLAKDGTLWLNLGDSYASDSKWGGRTGGKHAAALHGNTSIGRGRRLTGLPDKNLLGIPWRVAFALQGDGWILRNDTVWSKPNAMPESVTDRLSSKHEHLFLFSKSSRYWFDLDPIRQTLAHPDAADGTRVFGGKNKAGHLDTGSSARRTGRTYSAPPEGGGRNPGDVWTIPTSPFPEAHFATMPAALAARCVQAGCKPNGTVLDPFSGSGTTGLAATRHGRKYVGIDLNREYLDLSLKTRLAQADIDLGGTA